MVGAPAMKKFGAQRRQAGGQPERRHAANADSATLEEQCHPRKIFIGGLAHKTTTQQIRDYFSRYGSIVDAVVLRWPDGRSRGLGYVTLADAASASAALNVSHQVGGRQVDTKRAVPGTNKLFVGGLPQNTTAAELREHFEAFGVVSDAVVMIDPATSRSRGFGFVCFLPGQEGGTAIAEALEQYDHHRIRGKWIEVKSAAPPHKLIAKDSDGLSSTDAGSGSIGDCSPQSAGSGSVSNRSARTLPDDPHKVTMPRSMPNMSSGIAEPPGLAGPGPVLDTTPVPTSPYPDYDPTSMQAAMQSHLQWSQAVARQQPPWPVPGRLSLSSAIMGTLPPSCNRAPVRVPGFDTLGAGYHTYGLRQEDEPAFAAGVHNPHERAAWAAEGSAGGFKDPWAEDSGSSSLAGMGESLQKSLEPPGAGLAAETSSQLHVPSAADIRDNAAWKAIKPMATGAAAGMSAAICTQPLDTLNFRVQVARAEGKTVSPFAIASQTVRNEGVLVFYKALSAGMLRHVIYTGGRFGLFDTLLERSKDPMFESVPGFAKKSFCAMTTGGLAAAAANPADLSLVRMQADSLLPAAERRNYRGVFHAIATIRRTEGVGGLFKGVSATSVRAMFSTFGSLAFNAQAKEMLQEAGAPGPVPVIGGCLIAGFASAFFSLPFDFVKTQVQRMKPDPVTGELPYAGPLDCAAKQLKAGGPLRFWSGLPTYYLKMAPQVGVALLVQDKVKGMWVRMGI